MGDSEFHLIYLEPSQWNDWDNFVERSGQGTVFQTSSYINSVRTIFDRRAEIIAVTGRNHILGGVVLYPQNKFGKQYVTLPYFIPYNSIILDDFPETSFYFRKNVLQNKVTSLLREEVESQFVFCEFHQSTESNDLRQFVWSGWNFKPEYTVHIPLQESETLLDRIERDQRRRIRKIQKLNIEFEEFSNVHVLFDLMEESYQIHGLFPPISRKNFLNFSEHLIRKKLCRMFYVKESGNIISALLVVENKPMVYALFSGRKSSPHTSSAELYLFWRVAKFYREMNYHNFDLLGAMVPSIAKVKLELGGILQRSDKIQFFKNKWYKFSYYYKTRREYQKRIMG